MIKKRLIDANALIEQFDESIFEGFVMKRLIEMQPTVDAVEVVHGEWEIIEDDYFDLVELKCSACGENYGFESYEDCIPRNHHYCPNCGAKMDGGAEHAC